MHTRVQRRAHRCRKPTIHRACMIAGIHSSCGGPHKGRTHQSSLLSGSTLITKSSLSCPDPRFRCDELELPTIVEGPKPGGGEAEVPGHRCRDLQLPTTILSAGSCMVGPHFTILTSQLFRLVEVFVRSRTNRKRSSWISFLGDTLPSAPRGPSARACTGLARRDAAAGVCIVPQP